MSDKKAVIAEMTAIVDTYMSAEHPLPVLLELRKKLSVWSYRLSAHVRQTYGEAGLGYARRKFEIAKHIVGARNIDAKAPINFLELSALKTPEVMAAQEKEIWAEAEKEELVATMRAARGVLDSLSQEIAELRSEKSNPHHQNEGA